MDWLDCRIITVVLLLHSCYCNFVLRVSLWKLLDVLRHKNHLDFRAINICLVLVLFVVRVFL